MRKYLSLAAILFVALFSSCKKDDDSSDNNVFKTSPCKVLVMYYAVGGGDLDDGNVRDLAFDIHNGTSDKVKMVGQIKFSASIEATLPEAQQGCMRFDIDNASAFKGGTEWWDKGNEYSRFLSDIKAQKLEGSKTDTEMGEHEEIVKFINWAVALHPAEKYILVIGDHGGGWTIGNDAYTEQTRALSFDDNTNESDPITTRILTNAIAASNLPNHRLDCFFADACNMAQWENLYEWARNIDYAIASVETTNGDMHQTLLKDLESYNGDLKSTLCTAVKNIIGNIDNNTKNWYDNDLVLFDLSQIGEMKAPIQAVRDAMLADFRSINATTYPIMQSAIWKASRHANTAGPDVFFAMSTAQKNEFTRIWPTIEVKDLAKENMPGFWSVIEYSVDSIKVKDTDAAHLAFINKLLAGEDNTAQYHNTAFTKTTLCLGSLVKCFAEYKNDAATNALRDNFLAAYNKVAISRYATSWNGKTPDLDYDITPLVTWQDFSADAKNATENIATYKASTFDKAVQWSNLMCNTQLAGNNFWTYTDGTNPAHITNGRPNPWSNRYARFWLKHPDIDMNTYWQTIDK